jgi:predicted acyltransferase
MTESKRLIALDVFRGATVALMILVNNPGTWGAQYGALKHAPWHGWTPTDFVFPFFLFIVGVAMAFAFRKYDYKLNKDATKKIIKRTLIIYGLGIFLGLLRPVAGATFGEVVGNLFGNWRLVGVLPRIALCYLFASLMVLQFNKKTVIWISAGILVGYWVLLASTGGFGIEDVLVRKVDLAILGEGHIYHGYHDSMGQRIAFDPEGLLSTLPAIVTTILGYLTGMLILETPDKKQLVKKMLIRGAAFLALGLLWGLFFPINKPIWSSSYVILMGGWSMLFLGISILLIDVLGWKSATEPFVVFGSNPLFIFVLSAVYAKLLAYIKFIPMDGAIVSTKTWLFAKVFMPMANYSKIDASLLFALTTITIFWAISLILYRKKIFIKI